MKIFSLIAMFLSLTAFASESLHEFQLGRYKGTGVLVNSLHGPRDYTVEVLVGKASDNFDIWSMYMGVYYSSSIGYQMWTRGHNAGFGTRGTYPVATAQMGNNPTGYVHCSNTACEFYSVSGTEQGSVDETYETWIFSANSLRRWGQMEYTSSSGYHTSYQWSEVLQKVD